MPVTARDQVFDIPVNYEDAGTQYYFGVGWVTGSVISLKTINTGTSYATSAELSATIPFTWGANDMMVTQFSYEAA